MVGVKRKITPSAREELPQPSSTEPATRGQGTPTGRSRGRSLGRARRAPTASGRQNASESPEAQARPKRTRMASRDEPAPEEQRMIGPTRRATRILNWLDNPSSTPPASYSGKRDKVADENSQQEQTEEPNMSAKPASFQSADTESSSAADKSFIEPQSKYKTESDFEEGSSDAEDSVKDDCSSPGGAKPEIDQGSDEQKRSPSEGKEEDDAKEEGSSIDNDEHLKVEEPDTLVAPSNPPSSGQNEDTQDTPDVATAVPAITETEPEREPEPEPASQSVAANSPPGLDVPRIAISPSPAPIGPPTVEPSPNLSPADSVATTPIPRRRGYRGRTTGTLARGRGGRGRGRGRGGRQQGVKLSTRSEPMTELGKRLLARQKDLERQYRKVAAAQKLALITLAGRTESQIVRDPKAHMAGQEYESVMEGLDDALAERHRILDLHRSLALEETEAVRTGTEHLLQKYCNITMESIIDEHIVAAQGGFMDQVEKCRQAQDDDRTEVNGDENGAEIYRAPSQKFARGFDSRVVSSQEGARYFDRAQDEWDEFIQRAKILDDISPQINEMDRTARRADEQASSPKSKNISVLVDALVEMSRKAVDEREAAARIQQPAAQSSMRLTALADMAEAKRSTEQQRDTTAFTMPPPLPRAPPAAEQRRYSEQLPPYHHPQPMPPPSQDPSRQLLPHYPPPLSGLPPPPGHPHEPQVGIPRPLIPAGRHSQPAIPPLSEHLKLPDPFSSNAPRLPAPQGVGYHPPPHNAHHAPAPVPGPAPSNYSPYPPSPYMQGPPPPPPAPSGPASHPYYSYPPYMMQHPQQQQQPPPPPPPPPHHHTHSHSHSHSHSHAPPHSYSNAPPPQQMPPPPPPHEQHRYSQQSQHPHHRTHPY